MNGPSTVRRPTAMSRRDRKRVLIALAVVAAVIFLAGIAAAWFSRNDTICSDGKPPKRERSYGLGQTQYLCHNGDIVTK